MSTYLTTKNVCYMGMWGTMVFRLSLSTMFSCIGFTIGKLIRQESWIVCQNISKLLDDSSCCCWLLTNGPEPNFQGSGSLLYRAEFPPCGLDYISNEYKLWKSFAIILRPNNKTSIHTYVYANACIRVESKKPSAFWGTRTTVILQQGQSLKGRTYGYSFL